MTKWMAGSLALTLACATAAAQAPSWRLSASLTDQIVREPRFASAYADGAGLTTSLGYARRRERRRTEVALAYDRAAVGDREVSYVSNQLARIRYAHARQPPAAPALWLGGYLDFGVLYARRQGTWASNNIVSYAAWSSLGGTVTLATQLPEGEPLRVGLSVPLLSYYVRPSYGSAYPAAFVEPGTFTYAEEGVARAALAGGDFAALDRLLFLEAFAHVTMTEPGARWAIGAEARVRLLSAGRVQRLTAVVPSLGLTLSR